MSFFNRVGDSLWRAYQSWASSEPIELEVEAVSEDLAPFSGISIPRVNPLTEIGAQFLPVVGVPEMVARYVEEWAVTHAMQLLELFGIKPEVPPPLPTNIADILHGPCPLYEGYSVDQTHALLWIPGREEGTFTTLQELMNRVITPKGAQLFGAANNPLRFCYPGSTPIPIVDVSDSPTTLYNLMKSPLYPGHWILLPLGPQGNNPTFPMTSEMPNSSGSLLWEYQCEIAKISENKKQILEQINRKNGILNFPYEIISFQDLAIAYFLLRAKGQNIFSGIYHDVLVCTANKSSGWAIGLIPGSAGLVPDTTDDCYMLSGIVRNL